MKQLVILSGKGGTGKTSVTAAIAHLAATAAEPVRAVLADADVDASNLELVLAPTTREVHIFMGGELAIIDADKCNGCGTCVSVCRFDALSDDVPPVVSPIACDGCAACVYQCPEEAISMELQQAGNWFRSDSRYGPLLHAALRPAQENSGKLVSMVKEQARQTALSDKFELVIIDGPPGIGCPVISAVTGVDLALIVAEPTAAGVHDLKRVLETTRHFNVPAMICINKADLHPAGTAAIEDFCREQKIPPAGRIPFDTVVTQAMAQGQPVTEFDADGAVANAVRQVWQRVYAELTDPTKFVIRFG